MDQQRRCSFCYIITFIAFILIGAAGYSWVSGIKQIPAFQDLVKISGSIESIEYKYIDDVGTVLFLMVSSDKKLLKVSQSRHVNNIKLRLDSLKEWNDVELYVKQTQSISGEIYTIWQLRRGNKMIFSCEDMLEFENKQALASIEVSAILFLLDIPFFLIYFLYCKRYKKVMT